MEDSGPCEKGECNGKKGDGGSLRISGAKVNNIQEGDRNDY